MIKKSKKPFARFVCKKVAFYSLAIFLSTSFVIILPRLMPCNPVDLMFSPRGRVVGGTSPGGSRAAAPIEEIRKTMRAYFGLDKPVYAQYFDAWGKLLRGDLGVSYTWYPKPVATFIAYALPFTLVLVIPVLLISFLFGNWLGARAAFLKGKKNDLAYYVTLFVSHMPFYWFAMILIFLFGVYAKWFPIYGWIQPERIPAFNFDTFLDMAYHYALPFLTLLSVSLGIWTIGMRSTTLYEMNSDYILYSEQLGFRKSKLRSYAQRNAILPQFTGFNLVLSSLIGQTSITEIVFGWPGLGLLGYKAVTNLDYPLLLGVFLITIVVVLIGNLVIDILYGFLDPRIRTGYLGG